MRRVLNCAQEARNISVRMFLLAELLCYRPAPASAVMCCHGEDSDGRTAEAPRTDDGSESHRQSEAERSYSEKGRRHGEPEIERRLVASIHTHRRVVAWF